MKCRLFKFLPAVFLTMALSSNSPARQSPPPDKTVVAGLQRIWHVQINSSEVTSTQLNVLPMANINFTNPALSQTDGFTFTYQKDKTSPKITVSAPAVKYGRTQRQSDGGLFFFAANLFPLTITTPGATAPLVEMSNAFLIVYDQGPNQGLVRLALNTAPGSATKYYIALEGNYALKVPPLPTTSPTRVQVH